MSYPRPPLDDRLWARVDRRGPDECWPWLGHVRPDGYGTLRRGGGQHGSVMAHRAAYEALVGPIPDGYESHHVCGAKTCCNPSHMRLLTTSQHRGEHDPSTFNRSKTHCPQGHPYDEQNTLRYGGRRYCRACQAARAKTRRAGAA